MVLIVISFILLSWRIFVSENCSKPYTFPMESDHEIDSCQFYFYVVRKSHLQLDHAELEFFLL